MPRFRAAWTGRSWRPGAMGGGRASFGPTCALGFVGSRAPPLGAPGRGPRPREWLQAGPSSRAASSWRPTQGCHDAMIAFPSAVSSAGGNPAPFLPLSRPKQAAVDSERRTCGGAPSRWRGRGSRPRAFTPPSLPTPPFSSRVGFHGGGGNNCGQRESALKVLVRAPPLSSRPELDAEASSASLKPF